jgi:hexulose-6-phosphate isomerase
MLEDKCTATHERPPRRASCDCATPLEEDEAVKKRVNRRTFLATSAAAGLGLAAATHLRAEAPKFKTTLKKAMILGRPAEGNLKPLKDAGFDGCETSDWKCSAEEGAASRAAAEKLGLRVHSVLYGWAGFNSKDATAVERQVADVEKALRACKAYGADALLLVPCRIGGMPMPEAWEFQIEFDEKTGHVTKVAAGDNAKYQAYIDAHNQAVDGSIAAVKKLIPVAEETKIVIALENVWNNLWVKPAYFKSFVAGFQNPWVKAYLDLGNHVKYAPAEEWVRALGPLLAKCHVKDFKLKSDGHGGDFVKIRDGSINWPAVRKALDDVGYSGWMTIEDSGLPLAEYSKRLDLIIAGE